MSSNRPYLLRALHEWICDNRLTPHLLVDAGVEGVRVPSSVVQDGRVVLNIAPRAVAQLVIDNDELRFLARFGGASHAVRVPMAAALAIYAQENGQGMMFPPEAQPPRPPAPPSGDSDPPAPPPAGRPHLKVVK